MTKLEKSEAKSNNIFHQSMPNSFLECAINGYSFDVVPHLEDRDARFYSSFILAWGSFNPERTTVKRFALSFDFFHEAVRFRDVNSLYSR